MNICMKPNFFVSLCIGDSTRMNTMSHEWKGKEPQGNRTLDIWVAQIQRPAVQHHALLGSWRLELVRSGITAEDSLNLRDPWNLTNHVVGIVTIKIQHKLNHKRLWIFYEILLSSSIVHLEFLNLHVLPIFTYMLLAYAKHKLRWTNPHIVSLIEWYSWLS
jgi:hypothetical protein